MIRTREVYKDGELLRVESYDDGFTPLQDWERAMAETDAKLPRYVEDILDALDKPTRDKVAKKTLDAYNEKKAKRAEKP